MFGSVSGSRRLLNSIAEGRPLCPPWEGSGGGAAGAVSGGPGAARGPGEYPPVKRQLAPGLFRHRRGTAAGGGRRMSRGRRSPRRGRPASNRRRCREGLLRLLVVRVQEHDHAEGLLRSGGSLRERDLARTLWAMMLSGAALATLRISSAARVGLLLEEGRPRRRGPEVVGVDAQPLAGRLDGVVEEARLR